MTNNSPCVGVCAPSVTDVCIGCGRSLNEIAEWSSASETRRAEIQRNAEERLNEYTDYRQHH